MIDYKLLAVALEEPDAASQEGDCPLCGKDHGENKLRLAMHYLWWFLTYTVDYFFIK